MSVERRIERLEQRAAVGAGLGFRFEIGDGDAPARTREEWARYAREFSAARGFTVNLGASDAALEGQLAASLGVSPTDLTGELLERVARGE